MITCVIVLVSAFLKPSLYKSAVLHPVFRACSTADSIARASASPEPTGSQYIGLIYGYNLTTSVLSRLHGKFCNAPYLRYTVVFHIPGSFYAVMNFFFTLFTEINTANEFTNNKNIRARNDFRNMVNPLTQVTILYINYDINT